MSRRVHLYDPQVFQWSGRAVCGRPTYISPDMRTTSERAEATCRTCLSVLARRPRLPRRRSAA